MLITALRLYLEKNMDEYHGKIFVKSNPDEGTTVSICIPAVLYTEENRKALEGGNLHEKENEQKKEPQRE